MALLRGTLQRIVFQGRNHWSVAILRTNEGDHPIVGHLIAVKEGDSLELHGDWVINRKFGRQFKLKSCAVSAGVDAEGTIAWLTGLPDVGRARAIQIVEKFGNRTWDVIESDPVLLCKIPGITQARAEAIHKAYMDKKSDRDDMVFLKRFGLTDYQCSLIFQTYGQQARSVIERDPYLLMSVAGFGFKTVDAIAQRTGVKLDSLERACAGVKHMLKVAEERGHVFVPFESLVKACAKDLSIPTKCTKKAVESLNTITVVSKDHVYQNALLKSEQRITTNLKRLQKKAA